MKRSKQKSIIGIMLLLSVVLFTNNINIIYSQAEVSQAQREKLKVLIPMQYGLVEIDKQGNPAGYTYEYLMKIAQRAGWDYEFIIVEPTKENLDKGVEALKNGEIDILAMTEEKGQYDEFFNYPDIPYRQQLLSLLTLEDNDGLNSRTIIGTEGLRVAIDETATMENKQLESFEESAGISFEKIYAESDEECIALLKSGKADLVIGRQGASAEGLKSVAAFYLEFFYFATSKENPELSARLNEGIVEVETLKDSYFQLGITRKYFPPNQNSSLELTGLETEYILNSPTLKVGIMDDKAPISDFNPKTENFEGITIDFLRNIEDRSGLKLEFVSVNTYAELQKLSLTGKVDIIAGFPYNYQLANDYDVLLTSPMFSSPIVRITSQSKNIKNPEYLISPNLVSIEGAENFVYMESIEDIFDLVSRGEYGNAYVNGYMAQRLMGYKNYNNLIFTSIPSSNYDLCIAVSRNADVRLMGILEQGIAQMPKAVLDDFIYKNASILPKVSMLEFLKNNSSAFAFPVMLASVLIIALLSLLVYKSKRLNVMIAEESRHYKAKSVLDQMTGLYNNGAFKELAREYLSKDFKGTEKCVGAVIICDIDDFKSINDSKGHLFGDMVIKRVAKSLQTIFPETSIVGRMGGDEFAVLLRQETSREEISSLCTELLKDCTTFDANFPISLSIGAEIFQDKCDFDSLFYNADSALYEVKAQGKAGLKIKNSKP